MTGRAECGCPTTHRGVTVHRVKCPVRVGTPLVFPPPPVEVKQAQIDIFDAYTEIYTRAQVERGRIHTAASVDQFIEWAKQRLHVIALARAVLPSDDGKANPTND